MIDRNEHYAVLLQFHLLDVDDLDSYAKVMELDGKEELMLTRKGVEHVAQFAPDQERAQRFLKWLDSEGLS